MFLGIQEMIESVSNAVENALGSSLSDVLIQIGATLILFLVVKFFFWNKITDFLNQRKEMMETEFASAKQANEEAIALQEKSNKEYQDLKAKSKGYIDRAKKRGEEERTNIIEKAKEDASKIITQAEQEIELEKKKAEADIKAEAVNLATIMASKIIEKEIDDKKYQDLATEGIERSEKV
ncbi:MAG: F0F1 ATP synthase subunit B [Sphaerochaetaceae bacterium]|nr:F0F1 ATP synthase subunit B [Sphaerochaetaceae bacterium]